MATHFTGSESKTGEGEEAEAEAASSDSVDAYPESTGDARHDGRSRSRSHRAWAWVSRFVSRPRSTFEDWADTFTFLSGVVRGWRGVRENDDAQTRRARAAPWSRGGAGTDDPGDEIDQNLSCLWG